MKGKRNSPRGSAADGVKTKDGVIRLGADGIVRVIIDDGAKTTLEAARENVRVCRKLGRGRRLPVLVLMGGVQSVTRKAREYYAGEEAAAVLSGTALVTGGPISEVLSGFFLGLNRPRVPTRVFRTEARALAWLGGFVK